MAQKLTRLISYKLLKEVYGDRPHPNFKKYEIYDLRKAVKCWYEFNGNIWVRI
jgi:hypothetical protein